MDLFFSRFKRTFDIGELRKGRKDRHHFLGIHGQDGRLISPELNTHAHFTASHMHHSPESELGSGDLGKQLSDLFSHHRHFFDVPLLFQKEGHIPLILSPVGGAVIKIAGYGSNVQIILAIQKSRFHIPE